MKYDATFHIMYSQGVPKFGPPIKRLLIKDAKYPSLMKWCSYFRNKRVFDHNKGKINTFVLVSDTQLYLVVLQSRRGAPRREIFHAAVPKLYCLKGRAFFSSIMPTLEPCLRSYLKNIFTTALLCSPICRHSYICMRRPAHHWQLSLRPFTQTKKGSLALDKNALAQHCSSKLLEKKLQWSIKPQIFFINSSKLPEFHLGSFRSNKNQCRTLFSIVII